MSFVRFTEDGSQVYIFEEAGETKVCCRCALTPGVGWSEFFRTHELAAMLTHVAEHRAAGHVVPDWVEDILVAEWIEA